MKKILLGAIVLFSCVSTYADILIPPQRKEKLVEQYEKGLANCPADKPIYNGQKCYSCDELSSFTISPFMKCTEICPNRYVKYECMTRCILKNPPNDKYIYTTCEGWALK